MRKSFNVLVMANLLQSLFGLDLPSSSSYSSSSSGRRFRAHPEPTRQDPRPARPMAGSRRPWVCKPTGETFFPWVCKPTGEKTFSPHLFSRGLAQLFSFFFFFHSSFFAFQRLWFLMHIRAISSFYILIMAPSAAACTSFFVCNLLFLCEVSYS
jgi:hypothetical protein